MHKNLNTRWCVEIKDIKCAYLLVPYTLHTHLTYPSDWSIIFHGIHHSAAFLSSVSSPYLTCYCIVFPVALASWQGLQMPGVVQWMPYILSSWIQHWNLLQSLPRDSKTGFSEAEAHSLWSLRRVRAGQGGRVIWGISTHM